MSVAGISSTRLTDAIALTSAEQINNVFKQLGKDLKSGDLSAAQSDLVTLENKLASTVGSSTATTSTTSSVTASSATTSPVQQALNQLSQALQSGDLPQAQQAFAILQQDLQSVSSGGPGSSAVSGHHQDHRHHAGSDGSSQTSSTASGSSTKPGSSANQLWTQLGQALQSGNLAGAQQIFNAMQLEFQRAGSANDVSQAQSSQSTISVTA